MSIVNLFGTSKEMRETTYTHTQKTQRIFKNVKQKCRKAFK